MSWHKYGGIGHDSKYKNLMSNNLASNEIAKMNKLYANNICVANDVDISGRSLYVQNNLDVSGHVTVDGTITFGDIVMCDISACSLDLSQNLVVDGSVNFTKARKIFMQQGNIILDEQGQIGLGKDVLSVAKRTVLSNNIGNRTRSLKRLASGNQLYR